MNFIWDIVLNAKSHGTEEEELFFRPAKESSPWYEQSFPILNEDRAEGPEIEYNPLYRFDALFHDLLREDLDESPEFQAQLFDAVSHLLVQTALHHGLSKREYYIRRLLKELEEGEYGPAVAQHIHSIAPEKRERLAALVLTQLQTGSNLLLFRRAVFVLFPNALLYQERTDLKRILLYVGAPKTEMLEQSVQLIETLFLPVCFRLRTFWSHHFGVVGVDAVMKLDQIEIY